MNNYNRQTLVTYDLRRLDSRVVEDVWNQIRVEARGNRLRVWFNRMHPSSDTDKGLRIDFKDIDMPVLSGSIGVKAQGTGAWFDNIVVIPIRED